MNRGQRSLNNLSSGMQKTLLILTDVHTLPPGSIYLIDEYENSLGVNSVNFFPNLLLEEDFKIQFLITSHHPYIINKIPIKNWYVFHRKGTEVKIIYGEKLITRYGKSKQQTYIKLLNDPFFLEGKE
ncbi:ATP-binding protein [candidate division KSB1 bacterium]|nr:ATP-binding protein [candidate division KSB1 bacterium]